MSDWLQIALLSIVAFLVLLSGYMLAENEDDNPFAYNMAGYLMRLAIILTIIVA